MHHDQVRINTGFHRFTEIGQNFHDKKEIYVYVFNKSKLQVVWLTQKARKEHFR